jgi:O-acetylserine/cysteine efflux transporter
MLREQLHARQIIGMVIASMGIFMIVGSPHLAGHLTEVGLVVLAALFFAIFNIEIKQIGKFPRLALLGWASLIAAPQFFVLSFFLEQADFLKLQPLNITGTLSITYLIFSPIASFGLWFYLLQLYNINKVIPFAQLVPVFGVLSATLFLGEKLTPHMLIGGTMAISGVAIVAIKLPNKLLLAKKRLFD